MSYGLVGMWLVEQRPQNTRSFTTTSGGAGTIISISSPAFSRTIRILILIFIYLDLPVRQINKPSPVSSPFGLDVHAKCKRLDEAGHLMKAVGVIPADVWLFRKIWYNVNSNTRARLVLGFICHTIFMGYDFAGSRSTLGIQISLPHTTAVALDDRAIEILDDLAEELLQILVAGIEPSIRAVAKTWHTNRFTFAIELSRYIPAYVRPEARRHRLNEHVDGDSHVSISMWRSSRCST